MWHQERCCQSFGKILNHLLIYDTNTFSQLMCNAYLSLYHLLITMTWCIKLSLWLTFVLNLLGQGKWDNGTLFSCSMTQTVFSSLVFYFSNQLRPNLPYSHLSAPLPWAPHREINICCFCEFLNQISIIFRIRDIKENVF